MTVSLEGMSQAEIGELALAAKKMLNNPETRLEALRLHKKNSPDQHIPEIDLPHQFNTALAEERVKREALEAKLLEADVRRDIENKRSSIVGKGIPADKVVEVEKMMTELGIMNHDTAADFYLAQQKLATPTAPEPGTRFHSQQLPTLDTKPFGGNVRNWGKDAAMSALREYRSGGLV